MPHVLDPIPVGAQIVDPKGGITIFFRLRWEALRSFFQLTPTRAAQSVTGQNASLPTTTLYTTLSPGLYRITTYARKTTADGVSSSLIVTLGWTENGVPVTLNLPTLAVDSTTIAQGISTPIQVDSGINLSVATTYASNTPGNMLYDLYTSVEQLA